VQPSSPPPPPLKRQRRRRPASVQYAHSGMSEKKKKTVKEVRRHLLSHEHCLGSYSRRCACRRHFSLAPFVRVIISLDSVQNPQAALIILHPTPLRGSSSR
jgi:hypothetical protein